MSLRTSLASFLSYARAKTLECMKDGAKINIVIGNESADLDSLTSALLYAYVRSQRPPSTAFSPIYVPFLNIPTSGLRLRPEFTFVCQSVDIRPDALLCLDATWKSALINSKNVRWILVDHNKTTGELAQIAPSNVVGLIDHHDDEHFVPMLRGPEPRVVENCGSCSSLVVRCIRNDWDAIANLSVSKESSLSQSPRTPSDGKELVARWDAEIAKMVLASIVIDTGNLKSAGKVQAADREAVDYLIHKITSYDSIARDWNQKDFYRAVHDVKADLDALTVEEILIKDYKEWNEGNLKLGTSSIVKHLAYLIRKAGAESQGSHDKYKAFLNAIDNFATSRNIDVLVILTHCSDNDASSRREIFVRMRPGLAGLGRRFQAEAPDYLQLAESGHSQLDEGEIGHQTWTRAWAQGDLTKSRKQVAPFLRKLMQEAPA